MRTFCQDVNSQFYRYKRPYDPFNKHCGQTRWRHGQSNQRRTNKPASQATTTTKTALQILHQHCKKKKELFNKNSGKELFKERWFMMMMRWFPLTSQGPALVYRFPSKGCEMWEESSPPDWYQPCERTRSNLRLTTRVVRWEIQKVRRPIINGAVVFLSLPLTGSSNTAQSNTVWDVS